MAKQNILIWLPSPIGDAILCTPALRSVRRQCPDDNIWFYANKFTRQILSPNHFNNGWIDQRSRNPFAVVSELRKYRFDRVILFKNSFMSALTVFLARIPVRIGYMREGRGLFLTDKLYPQRLPEGGYKPVSMTDYYLALATQIGAGISDRT